MKYFSLFLTVLTLVSSCGKEKECHHKPISPVNLCADPQIGIGDCITDSNQLKTLILGKWNWTQTLTWSWEENKANPCTKNLNYTYEFLTDGKVNVYVDSIYSATSDYAFMQTWTSEIFIANTTVSDSLGIYGAHGAVRLCGNYLIIDNSPVDGPKITFVKEN